MFYFRKGVSLSTLLIVAKCRKSLSTTIRHSIIRRKKVELERCRKHLFTWFCLFLCWSSLLLLALVQLVYKQGMDTGKSKYIW